MTERPLGREQLDKVHQSFTDKDLGNEEVVFDILERGMPEEVELLRVFYNWNKEQADLMRYYAQLRRATLNQMREDIARRVRDNPRATEEEMAMGAYQEQIEPQVRGAVLALRRKGYPTFSSGFSDLHNQAIHFTVPQKVELPFALVQDLEHRGMIMRTTEQGDIRFECSRPLTIDELTQAWNQIAEALPDLGSPAPPSTIRMAESFRKRQNKLESE